MYSIVGAFLPFAPTMIFAYKNQNVETRHVARRVNFSEETSLNPALSLQQNKNEEKKP